MFGVSFLDVNYPELFEYEKVLYECFKPKVTTLPFTNSQCDTVIIAKGNVTDPGSSRIIARGFCWGTSPDPKITDFKIEDSIAPNDQTNGLGLYENTLSNLTPNTVYYLKAYAINLTDTGYGEVFSFKAPDVPDSTFIDPRDGQVYNFRHIGSQVWMTENLRFNAPNFSYSAVCYDFNLSNCTLYGGLYYWGYNWKDSTNLPSLAPLGWHIPSDSEWDILVNYLGGNSVAGGKMKDSCSGLWNSPNVGATNSSGFSGLPGGFMNNNFLPSEMNISGIWWSSTPLYPSLPPWLGTELWIRTLRYDETELVRGYNYGSYLSIRCIKN